MNQHEAAHNTLVVVMCSLGGHSLPEEWDETFRGRVVEALDALYDLGYSDGYTSLARKVREVFK